MRWPKSDEQWHYRVLVLLAQLAHNLIALVRNLLTDKLPTFRHFGMLRMVRDVFHITGKVQMTQQGQLLSITI